MGTRPFVGLTNGDSFSCKVKGKGRLPSTTSTVYRFPFVRYRPFRSNEEGSKYFYHNGVSPINDGCFFFSYFRVFGRIGRHKVSFFHEYKYRGKQHRFRFYHFFFCTRKSSPLLFLVWCVFVVVLGGEAIGRGRISCKETTTRERAKGC